MKKKTLIFKKEKREALLKAVSKKKLKGQKIYIIVENKISTREMVESLFVDSKESITVLTKRQALVGIDLSDGIGFLYGLNNVTEVEWLQIRGRFIRIQKKSIQIPIKVFINEIKPFMIS